MGLSNLGAGAHCKVRHSSVHGALASPHSHSVLSSDFDDNSLNEDLIRPGKGEMAMVRSSSGTPHKVRHFSVHGGLESPPAIDKLGPIRHRLIGQAQWDQACPI